MSPVDTGVVAVIGWPDSTVGAVGAVLQGDVTGTTGPASGDGGPDGGGDGGPGDGGVGDESRSYICDSNDGDGSPSYTCDPNDRTSIGQTSGVGDGSRRYTCDPNDGDGLRSYTCNPNDGVRPGRYISGRNDDARPGGAAFDHVDGRGTRRPSRMVHRRRAVPRSTTYDDKRLRDKDRGALDGAAIAGDPMSSTRLRDRPRRTTRLPLRLKDFRLV